MNLINLKHLRKEKNLTQTEIANIFNMSIRGYQAIENGINETNYENLIRFADFFGCSIDYLLGHKSNDIFFIDTFTKDQQKAISMIKKLDEKETAMLLGYLARMTNTPLETLTENKKDQEENYGG